MDGSAPYTLQELSTFSADPDDDGIRSGDPSVYHDATGEVTPGFVEVSAVYSNELSALPGVNDTAVAALSKADTAQNTAEAALDGLARKVENIAGGAAPEVQFIMTYYESEYTQLSVDDPSWEPDPSTMYVILPDQV